MTTDESQHETSLMRVLHFFVKCEPSRTMELLIRGKVQGNPSQPAPTSLFSPNHPFKINRMEKFWCTAAEGGLFADCLVVESGVAAPFDC